MPYRAQRIAMQMAHGEPEPGDLRHRNLEEDKAILWEVCSDTSLPDECNSEHLMEA